MVGDLRSLFSVPHFLTAVKAAMASPRSYCSATCRMGCDGAGGSACTSAFQDKIILEEEKLYHEVQRDSVPSGGLSHPSNVLSHLSAARW
jgi:hypothetical protein